MSSVGFFTPDYSILDGYSQVLMVHNAYMGNLIL